MGPPITNTIHIPAWSKVEREFCVEQYYLNNGSLVATKRAYYQKFRERNENKLVKCPTSDHIMEWINEDEKRRSSGLMKPHSEVPQKSDTGKENVQ